MARRVNQVEQVLLLGLWVHIDHARCLSQHCDTALSLHLFSGLGDQHPRLTFRVSSTCALSLSNLTTVPLISSSRSARVDLPWSMCATMQKLRVRSRGIDSITWRSTLTFLDLNQPFAHRNRGTYCTLTLMSLTVPALLLKCLNKFGSRAIIIMGADWRRRVPKVLLKNIFI